MSEYARRGVAVGVCLPSTRNEMISRDYCLQCSLTLHRRRNFDWEDDQGTPEELQPGLLVLALLSETSLRRRWQPWFSTRALASPRSHQPPARLC